MLTIEVMSLTGQSFLALEQGDLDFVMTTYPTALHGPFSATENMSREILFKDDFVCLVDRSHPEVGDELSEELYWRLPHAVTRFGNNTMTIVEQGWQKHRFQPQISSTAPGFVSMLFMLPGTNAIGTAQRRLAGTLAGALDLKVFESPIPFDHLEEDIYWHARLSDDPAHKYMREAFRRISS